MTKTQAWVHAFRLRTLPLALSSIITGSGIAFSENRAHFDWMIFGLCLLTTLLLQILSNLANDYGDSVKGADNHERVGPMRAVQSGGLTFREIKIGIAINSILCLLVGSALIYRTFGNTAWLLSAVFLIAGLGAIAAAIKYTIGKHSYGYRGWGDVFVFLFFGIVGVCGSYYLLCQNMNYSVLLPAGSIGFFSAGVLNLNNMRDCHGDAKAGKHTLVVRIGIEKAKKYHLALIVCSLLCSVLFVVLNFRSTMQLLFIVTFPLFRKHLVAVRQVEQAADFDPFLKQLAISTFIFALLFAVGMVIGE